MTTSFWTSKVTWGIIATFIIAGAEATGYLSVDLATTIITLLSAFGLVVHNNQITAGSVKQ
jgi:hypothetical protein